MLFEFCKTCCNLLRSVVFLHHLKSLNLVDRLAISFELLVNRHLNISKNKYKSLCLARSKSDLLVVWSDWWPSICKWIIWLAGFNSLWVVETIVKSDEWISVCIVAIDLVIYCVECEMITSVSVLCLVVDCWTNNLYTTCTEVSLEVCAVILCIPETPLFKWEEWESLLFWAFICKNNLLNFSGIILRYEESNLCL